MGGGFAAVRRGIALEANRPRPGGDPPGAPRRPPEGAAPSGLGVAGRNPYRLMIGMIRIATMLATLIIGLMAGPAVSLYGSPTVSPVTAA